jgi:iron complex transport system permease protein
VTERTATPSPRSAATAAAGTPDRQGADRQGADRHTAGPRRGGRTTADRRARLLLAGLVVVLAAALLVAVGAGALAIPPGRVVAFLLGDPFGHAGDGIEATVIRVVRLPRVLLVALAGAALGVAGVMMQGLFRNPLADPGLIGVASGAGLAAALVIVAGDRWFGAGALPFALQPAAAFVGALAATALVYRLATRAGATSVAVLLLAGLAIGALASAGIGLLVFLADDRQLRDITFWTLGSFGGATWSRLAVAAPLLAAVVVAAPLLARPLDALALGEADAYHLGVPVERVKRLTVVLTALAVGAAVAVAGVIAFVGVVVPHIGRLLVGPRHARLAPAAALLGAALLLLADTAARTLAAPAEMPLGVLTAAVGAPVFLHLLLARRDRWTP